MKNSNLIFEKKAFPGIGYVLSYFLGTKHIALINGAIVQNNLPGQLTPDVGGHRFDMKSEDGNEKISSFHHKKVPNFFYIKHCYELKEKGYECEDWYLCKK